MRVSARRRKFGAIVGLIGDRLQFGTQRLFALPQSGHSLAQLFERQQIFLIGSEYSLDAIADTDRALAAELCSRFLCWVGGTRGQQTTVEFLLDQCGVLKQSDDFAPDDLIEQILPHTAGYRIPDRQVVASCRSQCIGNSGFCVR